MSPSLITTNISPGTVSFKGALSRGFCFVQVNSVLKSLLSTFTHITYKAALSAGYCFVQVNSVLNSLLSTFTHITYKGALSREFCCVQVNSVLKSLLSTQNAAFTRREEQATIIFFGEKFSRHNLRKQIGYFFKF